MTQKQRYCWYFLLLCFVLLTYGPTLTFDTIIYDGHNFITQNKVVTGDWDINKILFSDHWGRPKAISTGGYRPVAVAAMWLEYQWWGTNPKGYFFTQLLWMWLLCILIFRFARQLSLPASVAALASVLFCVHPVHTDVVASLAGRPDLMFACFFLIGLWTHARSGFGWKIVSLLCVALGVGSKEFFVFFLPTVFFFDLLVPKHSVEGTVDSNEVSEDVAATEISVLSFWFKKLLSLPWVMYLCYSSIVFGFLCLRLAATGEFSNYSLFGYWSNPLTTAPTLTRLMNLPGILWRYFVLLVSPTQLAFDRTYNAVPVSQTFLEWNILAGTLLLLVLCWVLWKIRHLAVPRFLFIMAMVLYFPLSNFIIIATNAVADRWLLLPSIPFCLGVSMLAYKGYQLLEERTNHPSVLFYTTISIYLLMMCAITHHYTWQWRSHITLYAYGVQNAPNSIKIRDIYGQELLKHKRYKEALIQYNAALSIKSGLIQPRLHVALIYEKLGKLELAAKILSRTNKLYGTKFPNVPKAWAAFLKRHKQFNGPPFVRK